MGTIETRLLGTHDLTLRIARGPLTAEEILAALRSYYSGPVTSLLLWDARDADLSALTGQDIRSIVDTVSGYLDPRAGGKTALVFTSDLGFGLGRMFDAYLESALTKVENRSFRSLPEALAWLGVPPDALEK